MNPKLLIISLFCSVCTIKGQGTDNTESYAEEISVGNFKVVYNDELIKLIRRFLITKNEIKQMLERYAEGGTATITKVRANPAVEMSERVDLNLKKFISKRPIGPITSVSASTDPFPGGASMTIDFMPESVGPLFLDRLLSRVVHLQKQIKLLDVQRKALNDSYRHGYITIQTRNKYLMRNRFDRSVLEIELQALQMKIRRMPGSEYMEPVVPRENNRDDEELYES